MIPEDVLTFFDDQQGRRPKAILNVLIGKMTVSALFWGLEYQILDYLNFWKTIDVTEFLKAVDQAIAVGYLSEKDGLIYLTSAGQQMQRVVTPPAAFTKMIRLDDAISLTLLANQVISEFSFGNKRYIPVDDNQRINMLIKKWFKQLKLQNSDVSEITRNYVEALSQIAEKLSQSDADLLLSYLPNHVDPGLTIEQLAQIAEMSKFQMELKIRTIFSEFISKTISSEIQPFTELFKYVIKESAMPESTLQTWQLMRQGKSLDEVARMKRVKANTIKEHILMAAILDSNFPFDMFVRYELDLGLDPANISFASVQNQSSDMTFFDFRLVQIKKIKELKKSNDNR
jgi:uncharacterized protein YpbB